MKKFVLAYLLMLPLLMQATHLVGGCFQLQWLNNDNYLLTVRVLRDCENGNANAWFDSPLVVGIFEKGTNAKKMEISFTFNALDNETLKFTGPNCATVPTGCTHIGTYKKVISLPASQFGNNNGYYLSWQRCCRNKIINNIIDPEAAAMGLYAEFPSPKFIRDNTPIYKNSPNTLLCVNNLFKYNMDFSDEDGDELKYSLIEPINGNLSPQVPQSDIPTPGPYPDIIWRSGYDSKHTINGKVPLTIDPVTGEITCYPEAVGVYVASIRVEEFRFGVKIGEVRLELQFTVTDCPNRPPIPTVISVNNQVINGDTIEVEVPGKICVKIRGVDPTDSVYMRVVTPLSDSSFADMPIFDSLSSGSLVAETNFCLQTDCGHERLKGAFPVYVNIVDNGCPISRNAETEFWVRIKPMPLINPTDLLCMSLVDDKETYIYYGDSTGANPFFKQYYLYRGINYGNVKLIDSVGKVMPQLLHDPNTPNYDKINYTYFMVGVNKCDRPGPTSDTLGTFEQLKYIPAQQYFRAATVTENNKRIEINWPPTWERDFAKYFLYKSVRGNDGFRLIHTFENINDTFFSDEDVRVMDTSYCYHLVMKDTCDNIGPTGKVACSIVLRGQSQSFMSKLQWQDYTGWEKGADLYQVFRSDPATPYAKIGQTATTLTLTDDKLNFNEGLFGYYVMAHQQFLSGPMYFDAWSRSNTIELVQPPIVYVPNAFTANSDGLNDQFNWVPVFVKDFSIHIYNRWGEELYQTADKHAPWDGQYRSQPCQADVYFYRISYTGWEGTEKQLVGNFTLLR